ncbi:40S ribosomal protein S21 [Balamuthia mandrillaris]
MQNDEGVNVDLYIPRKCSATHRLITAKDHASVQISVGKVDQDGKLTGEVETFALCGYIRAMGEADSAMNRLARANGYLSRVE